MKICQAGPDDAIVNGVVFHLKPDGPMRVFGESMLTESNQQKGGLYLQLHTPDHRTCIDIKVGEHEVSIRQKAGSQEVCVAMSLLAPIRQYFTFTKGPDEVPADTSQDTGSAP